MTEKGKVTEHKMFAKEDPGSGWGTNEGRIRPMKTTISNCLTVDGKIVIYASEAEFTDDPIEDAYFPFYTHLHSQNTHLQLDHP